MTDLFETTCHCCGQALPERQEQHPFAAFWKQWPNKKGKSDAEKAWKQLKPNQKSHAISTCSKWFAEWRKEYKDASPILPASFLRRHVSDDVDAAQRTDLDWAEYWGSKIRNGFPVSPTAIRPSIATEMLARELVTKTQLREIGIVT